MRYGRSNIPGTADCFSRRDDPEIKEGLLEAAFGHDRKYMAIDPYRRPTAVDLCNGIEPIYNAIQEGFFDGVDAGSPLPLDPPVRYDSRS